MESDIDRIIQLVQRYKPGDLLQLSEIEDALQFLRARLELHSEGPHALEIVDRLLAETGAVFAGKNTGNPDSIVADLEKLSDLLLKTGHVSHDNASANELITFYDPEDNTGIGSLAKPDSDSLALPPEILTIFRVDAKERIARAQEIILEIEKDLLDAPSELVSELFRIFHTIKGECGMLNIKSMQELAHTVESLLSALRDGGMGFDDSLIELLLEGIDCAQTMLKDLDPEGIDSFDPLPIQRYAQRVADFVRTSSKAHPGQQVQISSSVPVRSPLVPEKSDDAIPIVKVRSDRISFLGNMIGELTIAMAQLDNGSTQFVQVMKIIKGLQKAAMELQTESAKMLFGTLRRTIRDLSKSLGKSVEITTQGEDLEIDRHLIEKIEEPLMHLIRNSLDHGLELPAKRKSLGKSESGHITLSAQRKGENVVISVSDDGRGLDRTRILEKAIASNLVESSTATTMADRDVFDLIFHSGFSTAETVSQVSGRGVGMEIVSASAKANRGRIDIQTEAGKGTRFDLVFPLNTAIMDGLLLKSSDRAFVLPVTCVVEILDLRNVHIGTIANNSRVIDLRGEILPLIGLREALRLPDTGTRADIGIVIDGLDKKRSILTVDSIVGKQEVVIKPLNFKIHGLAGVSGATILSEGRIGLILDTEEIAHRFSK